MIIAVLVVFGLCLGSFVNALVWRVHEQEEQEGKKKPNKAYLKDLSISKGRSMCPHCHHELAAKDLVPVLSWLSLKGKCRYCHKPISVQYPIVEAATAALFVVSYIFWPQPLGGTETVVFGLWLILLTGLMALLVYDIKWMLLPNRIMLPLAAVATLLACLEASRSSHPAKAVLHTALAVIVGGGIFYVIFQVSKGKWIGGGDVKLGWLLGLVVATPAKSLLFIFVAAVAGSLISLPLLANKRLKMNAAIPFGPFLIVGAVITVLFGSQILHWYQQTFLII